MQRKPISEIRSILNIYDRILENKKIVLEQDIFGIDELVHNPVTGFGGELGYGYDRGRKVPGITWPGHGGHLHVGFTDKNTAMAVMDKAKSLGLRTAENPYSMTHYVNPELHTRGPKPGVEDDSFHHQRFEGLPEVGKGVDITGSHQKLVELILWIEQTYAGNTVVPPKEEETIDPNKSSIDVDDLVTGAGTAAGVAAAGAAAYGLSKLVSNKNSGKDTGGIGTSSPYVFDLYSGQSNKRQFGGGKESVLSLFLKESNNPSLLNEEKVYGKFGKNVIESGNELIIPKDSNTKINSPVSGSISVPGGMSSSCKNPIAITHDINGKPYNLVYCNISNPKKRGTVSSGTFLGDCNEDVKVILYDKSGRETNLTYYKNLDKVKDGKSSSNSGSSTITTRDELPRGPNKRDKLRGDEFTRTIFGKNK